ncbi:uncharacterized protein LOC133193230 [Saccostrea echinata]|uniref:uncharacterized protein LOC133193230 n=1 Tax=Saccostrea echinata TaxID=191078 RepID=UPI002A7ED0C2|nr:uncharacterized protein LOC133193230 [Saccostrea echinata]
MVSINYPSGKKSVLVVSPSHKVVCKAILDNKNVDKTIVNTLCQQNPNIVVNAVTKIIEDECSKICHRGSGSFLQKKEYEDFINFEWENLSKDLQNRCPHTLSIISSIVQNPPPGILSKPFFHVMLSSAICLHGRNQEMSALHYITVFILARGGCTQRTIESLCKAGLCVHPQTLHNKLTSWQDKLDEELKILKIKWTNKEEVAKKFQLVGDNWDKDILPSYRTSERKTESLHLFQIYAIVDRYTTTSPAGSNGYEENPTYIPSVLEQTQLLKELTFIFASAIIRHVPQVSKHFETIFPKHLDHEHSAFAGLKTTQYSLGLFDTNENKTDEVIRLLRHLTDLYVPLKNEEVVDAVFFGGDRLTDERIQCAQVALKDSLTSKGRLEGFISKSEDFHRLMNFLEAIYKLTYSTGMAGDPCTAHYYRNLLGHRSAKGPVKNAYRGYKMLYYTILDAICVVLFMDKLGSVDMNDLPLPDFSQMTPNDSIQWLNNVCRELVEKWFFEDGQDICEEIRSVLENPQHEENYWTSTLENGRFKCHHCEKDYKRVSSLKAHESRFHDISLSKTKKKKECSNDELHDYVFMLFKLVMLHRNFDSAVDMGDGGRCVRSAKYELPIYHKTNKIKYSICSIHTTALSSGLLNADQEERFIANRFVNIQGGKNNNIALDEYIEMLNRDSKVSCTGHKTKESILKHSKEYPLLIQFTKQFEEAGEFGQRKGFHHLPSYATDVEKVIKDLLENNILQKNENRKLKVKTTGLDRNPFSNCSQGLSTILHRHRPWSPYGRLRDCKF